MRPPFILTRLATTVLIVMCIVLSATTFGKTSIWLHIGLACTATAQLLNQIVLEVRVRRAITKYFKASSN